MNPGRIGVLLRKDLISSSKSFLIIFAVVMPVVISLLISLVFGDLFSGMPRLGIVDQGSSRLAASLLQGEYIQVREFAREEEMREAVASGRVHLGLLLPEGLDRQIDSGEELEFKVYAWGQALLRDQLILATALYDALEEVTGYRQLVEVVTVTLGEGDSAPWYRRLLPLLVLMAVILGGTMIPAVSLIEEKVQGTFQALVITPSSVQEVFLAKALLGMSLGLLVGIIILVLNQALVNPGLLVLVLALGASLAAGFGVLLGAYIQDINTLFAVIKALGILLYAPALFHMFPQLPQGVARLFPTYYLVGPVITIAQGGGSWPQVAGEVGVLATLVALTLALVLGTARKFTREPRA